MATENGQFGRAESPPIPNGFLRVGYFSGRRIIGGPRNGQVGRAISPTGPLDLLGGVGGLRAPVDDWSGIANSGTASSTREKRPIWAGGIATRQQPVDPLCSFGGLRRRDSRRPSLTNLPASSITTPEMPMSRAVNRQRARAVHYGILTFPKEANRQQAAGR